MLHDPKIVVEKIGGKMKELATIGVAYSEEILRCEAYIHKTLYTMIRFCLI